jgi:hypothetical protein
MLATWAVVAGARTDAMTGRNLGPLHGAGSCKQRVSAGIAAYRSGNAGRSET